MNGPSQEQRVQEYADFIGLLTGAPVDPLIIHRFTALNAEGYLPTWSYEQIERLHLLQLAAKRHASPPA